MTDNSRFLGIDIKTCAKIIAIIGIASSVLSANIIGLVIFVLLFIGVQDNKEGYLVPAKYYHLIGLVILVLFLILGVGIGIFIILIPSHAITSSNFNTSPSMTIEKNEPPKLLLGIGFIIFWTVVIIMSGIYTYISYVIINRARSHILENLPPPQNVIKV